MDLITIVVTALVTAAVAEPTKLVIKDTYEGIKGLLKHKDKPVHVESLELEPTSKARQLVLREELEKADIVSDAEVMRHVDLLLTAIQEEGVDAARAVGVNLEEVKGMSLKIKNVVASGTGVNIKKGEFQGDIEIEGIRAGSDNPKN